MVILKEARNYLLTFQGVDEQLINKHLDEWKERSPTSMENLLEGMLSSVSNKQGMPNTIGKVENLKTVLYDFDPKKISVEFNNDWKQVFEKIKREYHPKGNLDINNSKSYWVIFCKAVISSANFLRKFSSIGEFNDFVQAFYHNEYTRVAGMGFALACFLKGKWLSKLH